MHLPEHVRPCLIDDDPNIAFQADEQVRMLIPADRWQAFCDALDAPPKNIAAFRKLLTEPSVLDDQRYPAR